MSRANDEVISAERILAGMAEEGYGPCEINICLPGKMTIELRFMNYHHRPFTPAAQGS
jgi:hypothetical protein